MTLEDLFYLSVKDCKRVGLLIPQGRASGVITWRRSGYYAGAVNFFSDLTAEPFALLSYKHMGEPVEQRIALRYVRSNLITDSGYYLFVCPETGRECHKLYFSEGRFVSLYAAAFPYRSQTESKTARKGLVAFMRDNDRLEALTRQPRHRYMYAGKETRFSRKVAKLESKCCDNPAYLEIFHRITR